MISETLYLHSQGQFIPVFHDLFKRMGTEQVASWLPAFLANLVGPMDDVSWAQIMKDATLPCGDPDCRCETLKMEVMEALDFARDYWKKMNVVPDAIMDLSKPYVPPRGTFGNCAGCDSPFEDLSARFAFMLKGKLIDLCCTCAEEANK